MAFLYQHFWRDERDMPEPRGLHTITIIIFGLRFYYFSLRSHRHRNCELLLHQGHGYECLSLLSCPGKKKKNISLS
jgi:hypothetical protein